MSEGAGRGEVTIGALRPDEAQEVLSLFKKVFNVDRSLEVWNWEFRDCPEGIHSFVGRTEEGRIVSQFCGIPTRMKVRDRTLIFSQIVDSMVDPDFRSGLKKPGLFASTVYRFVDHFGHIDREAIMFGLPNPPAYRIGRRLLGYTYLNDIDVLAKEVIADPARPMPPLDVEEAGTRHRFAVVPRFSSDLDLLFLRLKPRYEVIAHRDTRYMNWRYADCPQWRYTLVESRDAAGTLSGVLVLRTEWLGQPDLIVADWFLDMERPGLVGAALSTIEALASKAGMKAVKILVPAASREHRAISEAGYVPAKTQFILVARTYDKDVIPLEWLKDAWYYTMGDFDVV